MTIIEWIQLLANPALVLVTFILVIVTAVNVWKTSQMAEATKKMAEETKKMADEVQEQHRREKIKVAILEVFLKDRAFQPIERIARVINKTIHEVTLHEVTLEVANLLWPIGPLRIWARKEGGAYFGFVQPPESDDGKPLSV